MLSETPVLPTSFLYYIIIFKWICLDSVDDKSVQQLCSMPLGRMCPFDNNAQGINKKLPQHLRSLVLLKVLPRLVPNVYSNFWFLFLGTLWVLALE